MQASSARAICQGVPSASQFSGFSRWYPSIDLLLEQTVLVVDAVAVAGQSERRQRVQKAGSQTPQPAVSERRIRLARLDFVQVRSQVAQRFPALLANPQIQEIVPQVLSRQEFDRKIIQALPIAAPVSLLGFEHALDHLIPAGQRHRHEQLARRKIRATPCPASI